MIEFTFSFKRVFGRLKFFPQDAFIMELINFGENKRIPNGKICISANEMVSLLRLSKEQDWFAVSVIDEKEFRKLSTGELISLLSNQ